MDRIEEIIRDAKQVLPANEYEQDYIELNHTPNQLAGFPDPKSSPLGIQPIDHMMSWMKGFSYLLTGSPNSGKSTFYYYLFLIKSMMDGWKWCVWTPEMYDAYYDGVKVVRHAKDLYNLLAWTMHGVTPYEAYARKNNVPQIGGKKLLDAYQWLLDHFKFVHIKNRTPSGIMAAFSEMKSKHDVDGFLIDPWKSVKQVMNGVRADIWLEDVLYMFGDFALESNSVMNFVVHPKSLKDYKDETGEYRIITPFDLNGGAAWFNTMDFIASIRRLMKENRSELYTTKVRKQHIVGVRDEFTNIGFSMDKYRFYFGGECPIDGVNSNNIELQF